MRYYKMEMNPAFLHQLVSKKMTRREFLIFLGILILAVSGISGVLDRLKDINGKHLAALPKRGFGSGPYGI